MKIITKTKPQHMDKILWPEKGYTKRDLLQYYDKISPVILPYLKDRPTSLSRYPEGIRGIHFFQKNLKLKHLPDFVETVDIRAVSTGKNVKYAVCQNKRTLIYLADLGSIEMHPWASRTSNLHMPDYLVFDIDPGLQSTFDDVIKTARTIRQVLELTGIPSICKTSGKRGLHVCAPLGAKYTYETVRRFALSVCREVNSRLPKVTTLEQRIAKRKGRVYLDYTRNSIGQTVASVYSLRPTSEATVSTPLLWSEVKKGLDPKKFTIKSIFERLKHRGDLWKSVLQKGVNLERAMNKMRLLS